MRRGRGEAFRIVLLSVLAAVLYGIAHDQVTARVCLEYFTIGHPRLVASDSPTVHALLWGVIATWWVGALLGVSLAIAARAGRRPRLGARALCRPIVWLLVAMAAIALVAGIAGQALGEARSVYLLEPLASRVPADRHAAFLACLWAHSASYAVGLAGGVVVIVRTWRRRGRLAAAASAESV